MKDDSQLADEREILNLLVRVARAQDDRDAVAYRSCVADTIIVDQRVVPGFTERVFTGDDFVEMAIDVLGRWAVTQHHLFNHVVEVDGDTATVECDMRAFHVLVDDCRTGDVTFGGRYHLVFERIGGRWWMTRRALHGRYVTGDAWVKERSPALLGQTAESQS